MLSRKLLAAQKQSAAPLRRCLCWAWTARARLWALNPEPGKGNPPVDVPATPHGGTLQLPVQDKHDLRWEAFLFVFVLNRLLKELALRESCLFVRRSILIVYLGWFGSRNLFSGEAVGLARASLKSVVWHAVTGTACCIFYY